MEQPEGVHAVVLCSSDLSGLSGHEWLQAEQCHSMGGSVRGTHIVTSWPGLLEVIQA